MHNDLQNTPARGFFMCGSRRHFTRWTNLLLLFGFWSCSFGLMAQSQAIVRITAESETGKPIHHWGYLANVNHDLGDSGCQSQGFVDSASSVLVQTCFHKKEQRVALTSTHCPLNGVNVRDLMRVGQYILGFEPLSGYQLLAADANNSGTVTAFDIVELRKLILGTYQSLPKRNSWHFYDKKRMGQIIGNDNPFSTLGYTTIPVTNKIHDAEFATFTLQPGLPMEDRTAAFTGVKIGDIDGSALPNAISPPEDRDQTPWAMATTAHRGKKGSVMSIPVVSNRSGSIQGWQMDLNFDPTVLAVEEVEWPAHAMPQPENKGWNLNAEGNIRLIWWDAVAPLSVTPGVPVCQIKVRLLRDIAAESPLLQPNRSEGIPNLVFDQTGKEFGLQWENIPTEMVKTAPVNTPRLEVAVYPNPTQRHYRINIQSAVEQTGTIAILDLNGKPLSEKTIALKPGINTITSAQWPVPLAPGTYTIQVQTDKDRQQIRFVRL